MLSLSINEWIYTISVTFQLSGAVLLLIKYSFKNIEKGIRENKEKENHVKNANLILGNTQPIPSEYTENIWLNRIAFALIALGYLFGVFGENTRHKIVLFVWIIILSTVTSTAAVLFAKRKAKRKID